MPAGITAAELKVMNALWDGDSETGMTSKEIFEAITERNWKISTVITMLGNLVDKGFVDSVKIRKQKAHLYLPLITRRQYSELAVRELMNSTCQSSPRMLMSALFQRPVTDEQYEEIIHIIGEET